ncbi:unnamed protein product [Anisakis simplex]|uniref:Beta-amyloid-like protein (inferred by orthology to a C. elegans protein) n=1 Tax=Anisakis simplex TaxID=6269 RepID=A0A0M3JSV3_ANISI|nr:unnamed protein product [Anisakis simplex]
MRAAYYSIVLLLLAFPSDLATYIESMAANVDSSRTEKRHEKFVPLVAFECGFRNKFMSEDGKWVNDANRYATCQKGKLDILKYCHKAYPRLDITNIVEYSHEVKIDSWCREDGKPCKWTHTVRPYQCIVGEFHSEALQVPHGCRFGHVNDRQSCNNYAHWKDEAHQQCQSKVADGKRMNLRSFAVLEPCGLDLFTGVEFVCCPSPNNNHHSHNHHIPDEKQHIDKVVDLDKKTVGEHYGREDEGSENMDDDEDDDYDEDYSDEDDEDDKEVVDTTKRGGSNKQQQDPYFKISDPINEHERFKEAGQRLDKKHRAKIDKVMREWSDLEARYKKMKQTDQKGAEAFKLEMTSRFQKTVASLEEENKEQKKQIEDVHEERVQANLNEKKRQATHDYRAALAMQVGTTNKHNVLKTLKTYIRAEEKDRTHMLNRYRHLLRTDQAEAEAFKPILLHRLRYIDLRINGTLAMLRDFPELERQIRPIAIEFWSDYRRENTPEVTDDEYTTIGGDEQNVRLVQMYKDSFDRIHNPGAVRKLPLTTTQKPLAESVESKTGAVATRDEDISDENDGDDDDDDDEEEDEEDISGLTLDEIKKHKSAIISRQQHSNNKNDGANSSPHKIAIEKIVKKPIIHSSNSASRNINEKEMFISNEKDDEVEDDDDDEDEDDDDEAVTDSLDSADRSVERELHVEIEPIVSEEHVRIHDLAPRPSYAKHEPLIQHKVDAAHHQHSSSPHLGASTHMLLVFAASATIIIAVFAIVVTRRRSRHAGFIEVDVCTPEERHVNGMQVNGYENPTYSFFDSKP